MSDKILTMSEKMTRAEARRWLREHFAEYVWNADLGMDELPEQVINIFNDEQRRITARILGIRLQDLPHQEHRKANDA